MTQALSDENFAAVTRSIIEALLELERRGGPNQSQNIEAVQAISTAAIEWRKLAKEMSTGIHQISQQVKDVLARR